MSALTAALGAPLPGRDLAILCQMVENRVVGAPCGIMDQVGCLPCFLHSLRGGALDGGSLSGRAAFSWRWS